MALTCWTRSRRRGFCPARYKYDRMCSTFVPLRFSAPMYERTMVGSVALRLDSGAKNQLALLQQFCCGHCRTMPFSMDSPEGGPCLLRISEVTPSGTLKSTRL